MTSVETANIVSDLLGGAGAIFLAVTFLRRERIRRTKHRDLDPRSYDREALSRLLVEDAASIAEDIIEALAPTNYLWGLTGTVLLFLSFFVKLVASYLVLSS